MSEKRVFNKASIKYRTLTRLEERVISDWPPLAIHDFFFIDGEEVVMPDKDNDAVIYDAEYEVVLSCDDTREKGFVGDHKFKQLSAFWDNFSDTPLLNYIKEEKDLQMKAATVKRMMESGYRVKCLAKVNDKKANDKTANDKKGNDKKGNDKKANDKKVDDKKVNDKLESDKKAIAIEYENLRKLLARFCTLIEDVAIVESGPVMEKKGAYVVVRHAKYGLPKKGTKKTSQLKATSDLVEEDSNSEADIDPVNESLLLDDPPPTSHSPEASLNIENRYKKDPRSWSPPSTEMNVASPQLETENRYKKDLRNRSSPTETNFQNADPRRLQPQSPYQGRQPQQYPNQGRQPPQYPNQGRQPQQYPNQGRQPQQYPNQGRQPQQYPNQGSPTQQYPNQGRPIQVDPRQEVSYPGASPNSSGQRYGVSNDPKPNSTTEPQPTVVNRYKRAVNQNSTVPNFHGSRGQGR